MPIAIDTAGAVQGSGTSNPASPQSTTVTVGNNPNRVLLVAVHTPGALTITSVTYGGQTMTNIRTDNLGSNQSAVFILVAPPTGANTLTINYTGTPTQMIIGWQSIYGANQSTTVEAQTGGNGTFTNPSLTLTSIADNAWQFTFLTTTTACTVNGGNQQYNMNDTFTFAGGRGSSSGPKTPAGSVTLGWTATNATWTMSMISIAPAPAGKPPTMPTLGFFPDYQLIAMN